MQETRDQMAFLAQDPVDWIAGAACRFLLDLGGCSQVIGPEGPQVICIMGPHP